MTPTYKCGHPRTAANTTGIKSPRCKECRNAREKSKHKPLAAYSSDPTFYKRALIVAANATGSSVDAITGPCRWPELVRPRWAIMVAMRKRGVSLPQIGRRFNRDHSTVLHAMRHYEAKMARDAGFARLVAIVDAA